LDPDTGEIELIRHREAKKHYDVTSYVLPPACPDCIDMQFLGIQPGTDIHIINVELKNPSIYTVYNVRSIILWEDYDNRQLTNYEALTEIFDDGGINTKNPFVTFRDLMDPTNAFKPGQVMGWTLFIDFPKPRNYNVKFVIEGSFPGNSKDPWLVFAEDVSNPIDDKGEMEATVSCRVFDHQNDVTDVTVDLTELGFPEPVDLGYVAAEDEWQTTIKNEYSASIGHYFCFLEVRDVTNKWPLYDYVEIIVEEGLEPYIYVDSEYTGIPDGSEEHPYPTITTALGNFKPGQIIMVKDGTYIENVELVDGAHLRGYGDQKPVVRGLGESLMHAGQFVNYAVVESFILQGNGSSVLYGIHTLDASNIGFHDIDFVSTGSQKSFQQVVRVENTEGFVLADSRFQNLKASSSAPILVSLNGSSWITIESNLFKNFYFAPLINYPSGVGGVIYLFNCDDVVIRQNLIGVVEGDVNKFDALDFSGIRVNGGSMVALRNNLMYDFTPNGDCDLILAGVTINGTDSFSIEHQTIDRIGAPDQADGDVYAFNLMFGSGQLVNNILTNVRAPSSGNGYGVNSTFSIVQTYSDVWSIGEDDSYRYEGSAGEGVGGLNADPEYVNPSGGDYHLKPTSPCLTTGMGGAQMGAYGGSDPLDLP
jgi:hypothetical protein